MTHETPVHERGSRLSRLQLTLVGLASIAVTVFFAPLGLVIAVVLAVTVLRGHRTLAIVLVALAAVACVALVGTAFVGDHGGGIGNPVPVGQ
ncbi:MAG: hypothetical protein ACRDP1_13575 [Nocardioidaceae bacterium]